MSVPTIAAAPSEAAVPPVPTGRVAARRPRSLPYRAISWAVPGLLVIAWEALSRAGVVTSAVLPAPGSVVATAWHLSRSGELPEHLLISLRRAGAGFAIGAGTGLVLGVVVGFSRLAEALTDRSVQILRAIPFLAILPLIIVWFGVGEAGKVFLVALGTFFPLYLNTVLGIRQVDPGLLEMGRVIGLPRLQLVRAAILPGALPSILLGVRLSLTNAWLALVVAETVGAAAGIGFMATNAREFLQTDVIVLVIVLYALIGILTDVVARGLEHRLLAWHPNYARRPR